MHELIASPLGERRLILQPDSTKALQLPQRAARAAHHHRAVLLADAVRTPRGLHPAGRHVGDVLLVLREAKPDQFSRATWELNLGCDYGCGQRACAVGLGGSLPVTDDPTTPAVLPFPTSCVSHHWAGSVVLVPPDHHWVNVTRGSFHWHTINSRYLHPVGLHTILSPTVYLVRQAAVRGPFGAPLSVSVGGSGAGPQKVSGGSVSA